MNDTKFTPGPHKLDSIFPDEDGYKIVKDTRTPRLLAIVKNQGSAPVYEAQANAYLYAAALEMYEALKFVQDHCQLYGASDAARERIDNAIRKAEGRNDH